MNQYLCITWNKLWNSAQIKVRGMHIVKWKYIDSGNRRRHNVSILVSMFDVAVAHSTYLYSLFYLILLQCDLYFYYCLCNRRRSKLMGGKSKGKWKWEICRGSNNRQHNCNVFILICWWWCTYLIFIICNAMITQIYVQKKWTAAKRCGEWAWVPTMA